MKVIDFHSHIVPSRYPDRPAGVADKPRYARCSQHFKLASGAIVQMHKQIAGEKRHFNHLCPIAPLPRFGLQG